MILEELRSSTGKIFLRISYDAHTDWIHADWIGYPTPDNVARGALAYLDHMQAKGCHAVLNDNRNLVGAWDQSVAWLAKEWIPYALRSGLKCWAHIDNTDAFSTKSASALGALIKDRFEYGIFDDVEEARAWLKKCRSSFMQHA